MTTSPARKDIPRQRINLEVANIEAYSREPRALQLNYNFLPDGYGDTLVLAETLDEVMADKLVSLVNTTGYVRYRDIWDLRWLKQQGANVRADWVTNKIHDYRIEDYPDKLAQMRDRLPAIIEGEVFQREISRFVPQEVLQRTLQKPKFSQHLIAEVSGLLQQVDLGVRSGTWSRT